MYIFKSLCNSELSVQKKKHYDETALGLLSCARSYLSPGLDPEHVVRLYEGVFKGHAGVARQRLLLAEDDMQVSGSVGGSVNSSVTIKHSVVLALHTVL